MRYLLLIALDESASTGTPEADGQEMQPEYAAFMKDMAERGVLLGGWGAFGQGDLPSTVIAVRDVPHEWLLPRMRAIVHHGGAGTTGAALRAGVPSIVVPLGFDQPFWGRRVYALGVGPRPISRRRLTASWLAQAIQTATTDGAMRARAADLGMALRAEHGVEVAVAEIEAIVAGDRRTRAVGRP